MAEDPGHPPADPDEDLWEGVPLSLEGAGAEPESPVGDETVERPAAEMIRAGAARRAPLLAGILLWVATVALGLALAALALVVVTGAPRPGWRGPLLAFDFAVLVLVVRLFFRAGVRPAVVCRRAFCLAGLAAGSLILLGALLRSAVGFIYGGSPRNLLIDLFVFGLLGLAGCMIFLQCLRGRRWAYRSAAVSTLVFLILLALQPFTRYDFLVNRGRLPLAFLAQHWAGLGACGLFAAGFVLTRWRSRARGGWPGWAATYAWLVPLGIALVLLMLRLRAARGAAGAVLGLAVASGLCSLLGLGPLLIAGALICWRRRGKAAGGRADLYEATTFGTSFVALGALASLVLWLPSDIHDGTLELMLGVGGIAAAVAGAWMVETRGEWSSRWALVPGIGLTVTVLGTLGALVDFAQRAGAAHPNLWATAATWLWCCLSVGLTFAVAGLIVHRAVDRAENPESAFRGDVRLLAATGWGLSGLYLALVFALWAGNPAVVEGLRAAGGSFVRLFRDFLTISAGSWLVEGAPRAHRLAARVPFGAVGALIAAALFVLHLLAASRLRWALLIVAAFWTLPLAAGTALALAYGSRLFLPLGEPVLKTAIGRFVGTSFAARLLVLVVLAGLLARFWEAAVSALREWRLGPVRRLYAVRALGPAEHGIITTGGGPDIVHSVHFSFPVYLGVLLSAASLGGVLLLEPGSVLPAVLASLSGFARHWLEAAGGFCTRLGALTSGWAGYGVSIALVLFVLAGVHEEGRRGRLGVYPLLGAFWLAALTPVLFAWARAVGAAIGADGLPAALALGLVGAPLVALLVAALVVWTHWWWCRLAYPFDVNNAREDPSGARAARGLGSVGLVLFLGGAVAVCHGALNRFAGYRARLGLLARGIRDILHYGLGAAAGVANSLEARGDLGVAMALLGAGALVVLMLHLLAAWGSRWARPAMYAFWCVVSVVALLAIGYMFHRLPAGTWSGLQVAGAVVLGAVTVRLLVALAHPRAWRPWATA